MLYIRASEKSKAKRSAYTSSVKLSTFGSSGKGSRGVKARIAVTDEDHGIIRQSSLERILNNPSNLDVEYGYRVQVFSDNGLDSLDPATEIPSEAWMHDADDRRTIRVTKNTDLV